MKNRLNASALYYVLFLSTIFGLLLGGMVLFSAADYQVNAQFEMESKLRDNADSGIAYAQIHFNELLGEDEVVIDLFGETIDTVILRTKKWGLMTIIQSEAVHGANKVKKSALAIPQFKKKLPNLFIPDRGRPLSLAGDTRIEGHVVIPKSGLKRAYIEGQNYTGGKLLYGTHEDAPRNLPEFDSSIWDFEELGQGEWQEWSSRTTDSINHPFDQSSIHFLSDGPLILENVYLSNNIVLEARDSIFIDASAQLSNVIIKSPIIHIASGFRGHAQFIASKHIRLEPDAILEYPSVLMIQEEQAVKGDQTSIEIGPNCQVLGAILLSALEPDFRNLPLLKIEEEAAVHGFVYSEGKTSLKGKINGHLYTEKFYLKTAASAYENHLLNARIENRLPEGFALINPFEQPKRLKIMKWLQ